MIITYLGHSCFKIQDKTGSDGITVVCDPFDKKIGLKAPNCEADIVTISHDHYDHNNIAALRGKPFIVKSAGEYDYKEVLIEGIDSYHDGKQGEERGTNIIYRFEIDDISVAHLGDLGHVLDSQQLDKLLGTDILLIPVGGIYTINAKQAKEVVMQIEPRIVIPMHYQTPGLDIKLDPVDNFIKEMGIEPNYDDRLRINKKDLPKEDMELLILNI